MTTQRLTAVQRDVIDRLKDGWELSGWWTRCELKKQGEASRHVRSVTAMSLWMRGCIGWDRERRRWVLSGGRAMDGSVLVEGADA